MILAEESNDDSDDDLVAGIAVADDFRLTKRKVFLRKFIKYHPKSLFLLLEWARMTMSPSPTEPLRSKIM